ncbi:MAG: hypothetical protein OEU44_04435, partial [Gammaproteobacteria bacterium]|nr:hypothetical protein [Gammaproteobacteria bacterium]
AAHLAVVNCAWPVCDDSALVQDQITLVVQVNGKVRGKINVAADADKNDIEALVLSEPNVQRHVQDRPVKKFIVVPGKLVNVVA